MEQALLTPAAQIEDEDRLLRRLAGIWIKSDGSLSSAAYKRDKKVEPEISVEVEKLTTVSDCLSRGPKGLGLGAILTKVPRELKLTVTHSPEKDNYAHALIEGNTGLNWKENCNKMATNTEILVKPRLTETPLTT